MGTDDHEDQGPTAVRHDPLGEALHLLRLSGTFYCSPELTAPWGLEVPEMPGQMMLIVMTEGSCHLELAGNDPLMLRPGQLVLLPSGKAVALRSGPDADLQPLFDIPAIRHTPYYETMVHGGGGATTRMTGGVLRVDHLVARRLIGILPEILVLDAQDAAPNSWLEGTLALLREEARFPRPGGETILTRLTDVLVVQVIRAWLDAEDAAETGWLAALRDPRLGRALAAVHAAPGDPWSVARLAREAGMSRSAFSAHFGRLLGETPMTYVQWWRIQCASEALQETRRPIAEIALDFGYESEAAFGRSFKRVTGATPGQLRRSARIGKP